MATAYMQIMMKKLTLPEGDNALESYRKVLELQPQHQEARDGIENIRSIYISWADTAQRRDEWENAELFLSRALRITPSDTELNEALRQVREEKTAYLSREAEAARIGAVEAEAEPALKAPQALPATFPEVISIQNVKHEALTAGNSARALIQATVNGKASRVEVFVEFNKQVTSYEMNESGSSGEKRLPNDFLYTREIPLRYSAEGTKYVVAAYKQDGTVIYSPQGNIIEPLLQGPAVVINEFMVANTQTIADPQGDYDDWIELYNRTFRTVDLSGYYLSDDKGNPKKWKFPPGTTIGGYGYLLVWADGEAQYTGVGHSGFELHTNFQLSKSGEYVLLVDSDANENKILDGTIYDRQPSDFSVSRYPNGVGEFSVSSVPTPGIKN
jgi:tetratricopeptide (TPR) repeat protein